MVTMTSTVMMMVVKVTSMRGKYQATLISNPLSLNFFFKYFLSDLQEAFDDLDMDDGGEEDDDGDFDVEEGDDDFRKGFSLDTKISQSKLGSFRPIRELLLKTPS